MKKFSLVVITWFMLLNIKAEAQSFEIVQLILNIEKLNQLKSILSQMKKGYEILSTGYNTVKDLSQGSFSLHKTFLDGLLQVSSTVRNYKRIADIVATQQTLMHEYKTAFSAFKGSEVFNYNEIQYLENVYADLFNQSLKNLEELLMIITAGELRMNDAERIKAIDGIYDDMVEKLSFLRYFNEKTTLLGTQRNRALQELETIKMLRNKK